MNRLFGAGVALLAFATSGWSYTIDLLATGILRNTGYTSMGVLGVNDQPDGRYRWIQWQNSVSTTTVDSGNAVIINDSDFPFGYWRSNTSTAAWVSTNAGPDDRGTGVGYYSFYTTFLMPNTFASWNLSLTFDVWGDDFPTFVGLARGTDPVVNTFQAYPGSLPSGFLAYVNPQLIPGVRGYSAAYDSSPASGLTLSVTNLSPGYYTLRFDVLNAPGSNNNPTGLLTTFYSATADGVPEPSSLVLVVTTGMALLWLRRRRGSMAKSVQ